MKTVVWPGIVLGVLVGIWMFTMGFTGLYKHPTLNALFFLVIVIQVGTLIWALRRSAKDGAGYGKQVGRGTAMSAVAAVLIIGSSFLFTSVVFPHYFEELRAMHEQMLRQAGKKDDEIQRLVTEAAKMETPMISAITGGVATVITGLLASLVIAVFARGKKK